MAKWAIELGEFNVHFVPKTAVKAQVLANLIAEFAGDGHLTETNQKDRTWQVHTDGASNKNGSGVGVVLRTPEGIKLERAVAFGFKASNNEAEYEALILGLLLVEVC